MSREKLLCQDERHKTPRPEGVMIYKMKSLCLGRFWSAKLAITHWNTCLYSFQLTHPRTSPRARKGLIRFIVAIKKSVIYYKMLSYTHTFISLSFIVWFGFNIVCTPSIYVSVCASFNRNICCHILCTLYWDNIYYIFHK